MKVRTRLALLMMLALLGAGSIALIVNAITFQNSTFKSPGAFQEAIFDELHVDRAVAEQYVKAHPEVLFEESPANSAVPVNRAFQTVQSRAQRDAVRRSRIWTGVAICVLALVAGLIGWLIAGRTLRPIRLITARGRAASANHLPARVDIHGPNDKLKDLADTFDDMLDRLEHSFVAQRRFSAQVSHELRTPLAIVRSEADILVSDAETDATRAIAENIRNATARAERIISGLLALGRAESGRIDDAPVELDEIVGDTVAEVLEHSQWHDVRVELELHPVAVRGDRALLDCVVRNLVDNAARHNHVGGWVRIRVDADAAGRATLEVSNTAAASRGAVDDGHGIGLTVVAAAVAAHGGTLDRDDQTTEADGDIVVMRVVLPAGTEMRTGHEALASSAFVTDRV